MKRITITITEEQNERLCQEARRRRLSVSELVRERLGESRRRADVPGFVGIANKKLPYSSSEIDEELAKTFGRD